MYGNVQYILVPICVFYSVRYSVQYSLELRVRNNLQFTGRLGVVFHDKMWGRKLFFVWHPVFYVWHQLFVEYSEQYSEQCHGQFIVQYSVQCSGQYNTSK